MCRTIAPYRHLRKCSKTFDSGNYGCHKNYESKRRRSHNCSLRIATLALPTKRQCMETWRTNHNILPAYMMERLRQHILAETPMLQISDALNCFKGRKRTVKRSKKNNDNKKLKPDKLLEIRKLCALLGKKVATKLTRPTFIKLSPELRKISNIITADILKTMMRKNQKLYLKKFDVKMINECSEKITVWIANVLEDASHKLLQEDLRELEEKENPIWELIDDLLKNVMEFVHDAEIYTPKLLANNLQQCLDTPNYNISNSSLQNIPETSDLRSEQLEDTEINYAYMRNEIGGIVENIITSDENEKQKAITNYQDDNKENTKSSSQHQQNSNTEASITDQMNLDNIDTTESNIKQNYDSESISSLTQMLYELRTILDNIIKNINSESENTTENDESDYQETALKMHAHDNNNITNSDNIDREPENVNDYYKNEMQNEIEEMIENIIKTNISEGELRNITYNKENSDNDMILNYLQRYSETESITDQVQSIYISDVKHSHDSKDSQEDNVRNVSGYMNKKVKFSQTELAFLKHLKDENENYTANVYNVHKIPNITNDNIRSSPPYNNFTRNVDEAWPCDLQKPIVKVTASVSKSISSLGQILETDEKLSYLSYVDDIITHEVCNNEGQTSSTVPKTFVGDNHFNTIDSQKIEDDLNVPTIKSQQESCHENHSAENLPVLKDQYNNRDIKPLRTETTHSRQIFNIEDSKFKVKGKHINRSQGNSGIHLIQFNIVNISKDDSSYK
ncbi:hypothetical protein ACJJTC_012631 [Scirpophaga incertulas]